MLFLRTRAEPLARAALTSEVSARRLSHVPASLPFQQPTRLRPFGTNLSPPFTPRDTREAQEGRWVSNQMLLTCLGISSAAGAYYYFAHTPEAHSQQHQNQVREPEELKKKAHEMAEVGRRGAEESKTKLKQAEEWAKDKAEASAEKTLAATRDAYEETRSTASWPAWLQWGRARSEPKAEKTSETAAERQPVAALAEDVKKGVDETKKRAKS